VDTRERVIRRALPKRSQKAISWNLYKMRERIEVMKRPVTLEGSTYPRDTCEGCGRRTDRLQLAHVFGRRSIVGEPWASSRYLTAKLCFYDPFEDKIGCHEKIDRYVDRELRDRLEEQAVARLYAAFRWSPLVDRDPAGNVRWLVDHVQNDDTIREVLQLRPSDGVRGIRTRIGLSRE
jgi:hypothetical protein